MQECKDCTHAEVCNYVQLREHMQRDIEEAYDGETWPLRLTISCSQFKRAEQTGVAMPWFVDAPYWFRQGPSDNTSYTQDWPSGCKATLKGGGEDGK